MKLLRILCTSCIYNTTGLQRTHGRNFLDAEMKVEFLGYQMSPKSSRDSERLKSCNYGLIFQVYFYRPLALKELRHRVLLE